MAQPQPLIEKAVGKLNALRKRLAGKNMTGGSGMGHTRWATHGVPNLLNAHPHQFGKVTMVHNGIFENHQVIRRRLKEKGHDFYSDTDTEVAAHLLHELLVEHQDPMAALCALTDTIHGAYAIGMMVEGDQTRIYFAKNGSPLIVACNDGDAFFASDQAALVDYQPLYYALKDGEMGFIDDKGVHVFDVRGQAQIISWSKLVAKREAARLKGHKHFMRKEIFEQPETIDRVLRERLSDDGIDLSGFDLNFDAMANINQIHIIACGSAYYAGMIAKPSIESELRIPVSVEIASEYRYRDTLTDNRTLVIAVSQSGETADTLAALEKAISLGALSMSVCNVVGSAISTICARELGNLFLNAGPEISVASTKAFVAQAIALRLLTLALRKKFNRLSIAEEATLLAQFHELKDGINAILGRDQEIRQLAAKLVNEGRMFYLGRGDLLPVALEGALKMKELSYIFAEGYPAGELKHGPIAVIDPGMPVVVLFGNDGLQVKTASNLQEVKARGAKIVAIAPKSIIGIMEEC